jgi:hypothetical protein
LSAIAVCAALTVAVQCEAHSAAGPAEPSTPAPELRAWNEEPLFGVRGDLDAPGRRGFRSVGEETLWIFDADFEDLTGDNAGWTSLDMSGTLGYVNYWHKDTIHIEGYEWLGDSTWWCGTYNDCWRQPRGYGNNWICMLERAFPEVANHTEPGDEVVFKWDQRYALELDYDYGYIDVSDDGGSSWTTIEVWTNWGFAGTPGMSPDWDTTCSCHQPHRSHDLSEYAGQEISIRFRCETDGAYSSQDQFNNPPLNSCHDGAWQLDNFEWTVNGTTFWYDDCESTGDNGWVHDDIPAVGQTGVVFERVHAPDILRSGYSCWWRPEGWWMAAVDSESGRMVDGQNSWLLSPPIDISGTESLVGQWDAWMDLGGGYELDYYDLYLSAGDNPQCVMEHDSFVDAWNWWPDMGPYLARHSDDWDLWAWGDWLVINWRLWNLVPEETAGAEHMTGFMLDRQRVGVPVGGYPTRWDYGYWERFHDTYDVNEALGDTAVVEIYDGDYIVDAVLVVSSDGGSSWESLPMQRDHPEGNYWNAPPPVDHIAPATEIRYYFESTDELGNVRTHPKTAPDTYYEFSILPILGSVSEPAILLVDKHGRAIRGDDGRMSRTSEDFFREALDILGFEYDVYDVEVPSGSTDQSNGPDSSAYKYYDTQIWFTDDFNAYTIRRYDQVNLIDWLSQAGDVGERNLLLTGNGIGEDLMGYGSDTLSFYSEWLASEHLTSDVAGDYDTLLVVRDATGGFEFMTHDDRECPLRLMEWRYG